MVVHPLSSAWTALGHGISSSLSIEAASLCRSIIERTARDMPEAELPLLATIDKPSKIDLSHESQVQVSPRQHPSSAAWLLEYGDEADNLHVCAAQDPRDPCSVLVLIAHQKGHAVLSGCLGQVHRSAVGSVSSAHLLPTTQACIITGLAFPNGLCPLYACLGIATQA